MPESLNKLLSELHAERVRTWDPAKLQINVDQRRELVEAFDPANVIQAGDTLPDFTLLNVEGGEITRESLLANGPAVLIFFRFAGCPACNIALPYYQRTLWPELKAAGIGLVAVSPQVPERLIEIKHRHGLDFAVASDPGNTLARARLASPTKPMPLPARMAKVQDGLAKSSAPALGNCHNPPWC